jgi:hypothetical protein
MLENMARKPSYPCPNKERGCRNRFSIANVKEHLLVCVYGIIKCPFHKLNACYCTKIKTDVQEHAVSAHERSFFESPAYISHHTSESLAILSWYGEQFKYYQCIINGKFCGWVKVIGNKYMFSKYRRQFILRATNDTAYFIQGFMIGIYEENCENFS